MPHFYRHLQNICYLWADFCGCCTAKARWTCQRSKRWGYVLCAACWFPEESGRCDPEPRGKYELKVANVLLSLTTGTSSTCF